MDKTEITDLTADLPADSATLEMLRPGTAIRTGWVLTMAGPSHPKTLAYKDAKARERLHKEATIESAQVNGRKYKPDEKSAEEAEIDTMRWVVSRIVTWTPVKIGDEVIEFSDQKAIELFRRPEMGAFLQQIVDYLGTERAFMPAFAKT